MAQKKNQRQRTKAYWHLYQLQQVQPPERFAKVVDKITRGECYLIK